MQSKGIMTDDATQCQLQILHHVIMPIATGVKTTHQTLHWRYFLFSETTEDTGKFKSNLKYASREHNLKLVFRKISTKNGWVGCSCKVLETFSFITLCKWG